MSTKHTAGPWRADLITHRENGDYYAIYAPANTGSVRVASTCDSASDWKANARLIAAAPELLQALEAMLLAHSLETDYGLDASAARLNARKNARAAISKATGGES